MGDIKIAEGFIDAVMIRITATGAAGIGLVPTCTAVRLSNNTRTPLTVQEVGSGWYRVTDFAGAIGNAEAYGTEWAVAGAYTIYTAFKLFKVGGGVIADWEDGGRLDLIIDTLALEATLAVVDGLIDGIVADIGVFPTANYATVAAYVEDIRARLIVILADVTGLAGAAMRGTDGAALVASGWDAALATILDNFTAIRIGYLDELDFDLQGYLDALDVLLDGIIADIGVFPSANYATLAAYVEDIRARLIVILADVTGLNGDVMRGTDGAALVASGWDAALATILDNFTAGRIGDLDELAAANIPTDLTNIANQITAVDNLHDVPAQNAVLNAQMNEVIGNKTDTVAGTSIVAVIKQILVDTGTTLENRQDSIQTDVQYLQNSELFGSVMLEEVQLGAGAADVNMPNVDLPDIPGTIDRVYLHFKVRMIENLYDGVNKIAGAQSIGIKKAGGAWGADDIPAITFPDDHITLAALTREAGDVFGGKIDVSGKVDAFNETYNIRWEDGQVDQDFLNFNDIEMFLRVIFH
jgi:tetrahydromethanopterin S-methyltransferase subunit F